jgi:hypothetical protein
MYNTQGKTFFELATDRNFWLHLNPQLHITEKGSQPAVARYKLSSELGQLSKENMQHEGYFKIENAVAQSDLGSMVQAVEKIRDDQWPVTFSFVYDEFWMKFQELSSVLSVILGPDYKMMPTLYTFCVAQGALARVSSLTAIAHDASFCRPDGQTVAMNIWISLTDASPDTGCIYILPVQYDPNFPNNLTTYGVTNYQDIRALPTKAGDILGWNEGVYHWGGRSSKHGTYSRISIAASFQRGDSASLETPLLPPNRLPTLKQRLSIIAAQLLRYQAQAALSPAVRQLAVDLQALDERLVVNDDGGPFIYDEAGEKY